MAAGHAAGFHTATGSILSEQLNAYVLRAFIPRRAAGAGAWEPQFFLTGEVENAFQKAAVLFLVPALEGIIERAGATEKSILINSKAVVLTLLSLNKVDLVSKCRLAEGVVLPARVL